MDQLQQEWAEIVSDAQAQVDDPEDWHDEVTLPVFESATSWDDYVALYALFVQGQLTSSPGQYGPLADESQSIVEDLLELNRRSILTQCSQPGMMETATRQRAFVNCLLRTDGVISIERLVHRLRQEHEHLVFQLVDSNGRIVSNLKSISKPRAKPVVALDYQLVRGEPPADDELVCFADYATNAWLPLSVHYKSSAWQVPTRMELGLVHWIDEFVHFHVGFDKVLPLDKVVALQVYNRHFGATDLLPRLLTIIDASSTSE
jgi:hypothetical protein